MRQIPSWFLIRLVLISYALGVATKFYNPVSRSFFIPKLNNWESATSTCFWILMKLIVQNIIYRSCLSMAIPTHVIDKFTLSRFQTAEVKWNVHFYILLKFIKPNIEKLAPYGIITERFWIEVCKLCSFKTKAFNNKKHIHRGIETVKKTTTSFLLKWLNNHERVEKLKY